MNVNLIDVMGTDLSVVNAARVSFAKDSKELSEKDEKLIKYLAKHNHWSPFGHASLQFRIKAPIFVARQLVKHQVGLVWNEVSRRYVDDEVEFYTPPSWRGAPVNAKQGSSDIDVDINKEERNVELFAENIIKAGEQVLDKPMEMALMPSWSRVRSAIPFIYEKLIDAVENDNKK